MEVKISLLLYLDWDKIYDEYQLHTINDACVWSSSGTSMSSFGSNDSSNFLDKLKQSTFEPTVCDN